MLDARRDLSIPGVVCAAVHLSHDSDSAAVQHLQLNHPQVVCRCSKQSCLNTLVNDHKALRPQPLLAVWQDKVASSQSDTSPSKADTQQSIDVAEMQQGLQKSNVALQDAQSQLRARQEHVQELTQRLEAAQAEVASLQVSGLSYTLANQLWGSRPITVQTSSQITHLSAESLVELMAAMVGTASSKSRLRAGKWDLQKQTMT